MADADWTPVTEPRTWVAYPLAGSRVLGKYWNDIRDQMAYLKGNAAQDGTFLELAADATAGDSVIVVTSVPADITEGAVLYFRSGMENWALVTADVDQSDDETTIPVEDLPQNLSAGDIAPWPQMDRILIECPLRVNPGIGVGLGFDRLLHKHAPPDNTGSVFTHLGRKVAALNDQDGIDMIFGVHGNGITEELGRIRFFFDTISTAGSVHISTNGGMGFPNDPAIFLYWLGRISINNRATPTYTFDITGDLDLTGELIGVSLWKEDPAGTLNHAGNTEITGQYISTVATGTAPFTATAGSPTVEHWNTGRLGGKTSWFDAPTYNSNNVTVTTAATDYTVASATATQTGIHRIVGEASFAVATNDRGALFTLQIKRSSTVLSLRAGQLKLSTTRTASVPVHGEVSLTASDVINLVARKNAGTGSSVATGAIELIPVGY